MQKEMQLFICERSTQNPDHALFPAATNKKSKSIKGTWMGTQKENLLNVISTFYMEQLHER
jgi:hypothetical protein